MNRTFGGRTLRAQATSQPIGAETDASCNARHNSFVDQTSDIFRDMLFWIAVAGATGVVLAAVVMRLRREPNAPRRRARGTALAIALVAALVALAVFLKAGNPDTLGVASAVRLPAGETINSKTEADAFARRLSAHLEKQPRDARAWVILARLQFDMDHFTEAAQAYEKALALHSKVANDPAVWCEYADALGMTQGGKLTGRPRELIDRALALNPNHPKALEMAGSAEYAQGDYASALRYWRPLLTTLEPGSQSRAELAAAIARAERLAMMAIPVQRQ